MQVWEQLFEVLDNRLHNPARKFVKYRAYGMFADFVKSLSAKISGELELSKL